MQAVYYALSFLTALLPGVAAAKPSATGTGRSNILCVVVDDLRPELGCYGTSVIKSPNIDRLADRGMLFTNAYCQQAVCSPSRTSVMTGTRPDTNKVWDLRTHFRKALPDVVTLPQHFKDNGYLTKGLGKIYHGKTLDDPQSWSALATPTASSRLQVRKVKHEAAGSSRTKNDAAVTWKGTLTKTDRGPAFRATDDGPNEGGEARLADEAIAALKVLKSADKPFFLAVGFRKPHLPFSVPSHYWNLYEEDQIPSAANRYLPKGAPDFALVNKNELWKYSGVPDVNDLPEFYERKLKHGYYAAVSYMDAQLGRVLDELDRLELTNSTIVVLWGDHGWKLGEHHRWCKHSNVENDVRVPLILSVPGMRTSGGRSDSLVELVDIYPTLAELAGIPLPSHLEGSSAVPLLDNPNRPWKTAAFSQYPRTVDGQRLMGYSMRTARYRFTRWVHRNVHAKLVAEELYDHRVDPQENVNIADNSGNETLIAELTKQWLGGWKRAADSLQ